MSDRENAESSPACMEHAAVLALYSDWRPSEPGANCRRNLLCRSGWRSVSANQPAEPDPVKGMASRMNRPPKYSNEHHLHGYSEFRAKSLAFVMRTPIWHPICLTELRATTRQFAKGPIVEDYDSWQGALPAICLQARHPFHCRAEQIPT